MPLSLAKACVECRRRAALGRPPLMPLLPGTRKHLMQNDGPHRAEGN